MSVEELYGITAFYSQFNMIKQGKYRISVCLGTGCYVKGTQAIVEALKREVFWHVLNPSCKLLRTVYYRKKLKTSA
ncbi:MAG: hypothetical protein GX663_02370 [Clostridiales bacterium]|nr:hypothetical protein [Clostridiales bacterium]